LKKWNHYTQFTENDPCKINSANEIIKKIQKRGNIKKGILKILIGREIRKYESCRIVIQQSCRIYNENIKKENEKVSSIRYLCAKMYFFAPYKINTIGKVTL